MQDITGKRYGKLTVKSFVSRNKRWETLWICLCDCGKEKIVNIANLRSGDTTSCGCVHKKQIAQRNKNNTGDKSPCWKGGVTDFNHQVRNLPNFKDWRKSVWERDNYTCVKCGRQDEITTHHITYLSTILKDNFIETIEAALECYDLWDVDNGITLCPSCHYNAHRKNGKKGWKA